MSMTIRLRLTDLTMLLSRTSEKILFVSCCQWSQIISLKMMTNNCCWCCWQQQLISYFPCHKWPRHQVLSVNRVTTNIWLDGQHGSSTAVLAALGPALCSALRPYLEPWVKLSNCRHCSTYTAAYEDPVRALLCFHLYWQNQTLRY